MFLKSQKASVTTVLHAQEQPGSKGKQQKPSGFEMAEVLNKYETNYLQIITILLIKLKQNHPAVYYHVKQTIMQPYLHLCRKSRMPDHELNQNCAFPKTPGEVDYISQFSKVPKQEHLPMFSILSLDKKGYNSLANANMESTLTNAFHRSSMRNSQISSTNLMRESLIKIVLVHRRCLINKRKESKSASKEESMGKGSSKSKYQKYLCSHLHDFKEFLSQELRSEGKEGVASPSNNEPMENQFRKNLKIIC
jgi:hypothetical protein